LKFLLARLVREIQQKRLIAPHWYLVGYHAAISDFIWDYTRNPLKSLDWDAYMQEQVEKGNVKYRSYFYQGYKNKFGRKLK